MKLGFFDKVKGFILRPTDTFRAVMEDTLGDALKYVFIWSVVAGAIQWLITAVMLTLGSSTISGEYEYPDWIIDFRFLLIPIMALLSGILSIIGVLVWGAWQHLCVLICGGRNGYTQTVKAGAYGNTPSYLFGWNIGWIPFIGPIIVSIGTLIVTIIGLRELHEISTGRAIAAWLLAMALPVILIIVLMIILIASY